MNINTFMEGFIAWNQERKIKVETYDFNWIELLIVFVLGLVLSIFVYKWINKNLYNFGKRTDNMFKYANPAYQPCFIWLFHWGFFIMWLFTPWILTTAVVYSAWAYTTVYGIAIVAWLKAHILIAIAIVITIIAVIAFFVYKIKK